MKRFFFIFTIAMTLAGLGACSGGAEQKKAYLKADSLNRLSYRMRYKDLAAASRAASEAYKYAEGNSDLTAEALNNMGFCAFMRMDFERASRLFKRALEEADNQIELLVADVGMMKICQRTSMNKEFYDYRNRALRRIRRIREDEVLITDVRRKTRFNYAVSEFYIVSSIYFYYLQQQRESLAAINSVDESTIRQDTAQWLYYEYMRGSGGMYEASSREQVIAGEFSYLADCLLQSRAGGYIYFEANALQSMAELMNFGTNRRILERHRPGVLRMVNDRGLPVDSLPLDYARQALDLFKRYGDWYQISGTYRTLATYYNYSGQPEKALPNLEKALQYVNRHHEKYYHCTDTTDRLLTYRPNAGRPVELQWIADEGIRTVPEWILRLREQLSRTYSAMGMKPESDYNRNIYLDLLDYTRQDKALESRYAALERESGQLNVLLSMVVAGFWLLIILFVILARRWRKRNHLYLHTLRQVLELCRRITSTVPVHASSTEEVVGVLQESVRADFLQLFGAEDMQIRLSREDVKDSDCFPLVAPGKDEARAWLEMTLKSPLRKDEKALLNLILPYLAWTLENGLNLVSLDDERRRLEKEQYIHARHLAENKRQNAVKKACLSIVTGILPYIDRVMNEVKKLESAPYARDEAIKRGKFGYIDELITRINEYNEILALWIKMRQGALSLNIENFGLGELFGVIQKGRRSFDLKHQTLVVEPTELVVKADKALTLFMMNTLVENARKYTPEGGRVELHAREEADYVEISVMDNGRGLSEEDIRRILGEKVYDSARIGLDTADDADELRRQKGSGFGLMNCKGIIEKYRKTNALFQVCRFDIESKPGKGSRFYFRLPKGLRKGALGVVLLLLATFAGGCRRSQPSAEAPAVRTDSLLAIANEYANWVYDCNVNGRYREALGYADSVLHYMNMYYLRHSGKSGPLLSRYRSDMDITEQRWLAGGFNTDYYILLDVRNEAAVAGLALKDFRTYYYNNLVYTSLYKQISKDRSLEQYCERMEQSAGNKMIALALFVLLVAVCLVGYYALYLRHRLHYRYNMEQVFAINKVLFSVLPSDGQENEVDWKRLLERLSGELNELIPLTELALAVQNDDSGALKFVFCRDESEEASLAMSRSFEKRRVVWAEGGAWSCFPLITETGGENRCLGVLGIRTSQSYVREEDRLLVELALSYLAVVLHYALVSVRRKYNDIELVQDDARRTRHEENLLHVQNLVLDNCLSTIKHETIYYPNRIKQIVDRLNGTTSISEKEEREQLQVMDELVSYYKDIFTLLSLCAARQLDEVTFRRTTVDVDGLLEQAAKFHRKALHKLPYDVTLHTVAEPGLTVSGDAVLLAFALENLITEALRYREAGELRLEAVREQDFVRFDFIDGRRTYTQEQLNELFYPSLERMKAAGDQSLTGTEFLVCKQIIRDHDEYVGRRGCRINASPLPGGKGYKVWFTVPYKERNQV